MDHIDIESRQDLQDVQSYIAELPQPAIQSQRDEELENKIILRGKTELRLLATLREQRGPCRWLPHAVKKGHNYLMGTDVIVAKTHRLVNRDVLTWLKLNNKNVSEHISNMERAAKAAKTMFGLTERQLGYYDRFLTENESTIANFKKMTNQILEAHNQYNTLANGLISVAQVLNDNIKWQSKLYFGTIGNQPHQGLTTSLVNFYTQFDDLQIEDATLKLMELENIDDNMFSASKLFKQDSWYRNKNGTLQLEYSDYYDYELNRNLIKGLTQPVSYYDFYGVGGSLLGRVKKCTTKSSNHLLLPVSFWSKSGDEVTFPLHIPFKETPLYNVYSACQNDNADIFISNSLEIADNRTHESALRHPNQDFNPNINYTSPGDSSKDQSDKVWISWPSWGKGNAVINADFKAISKRRVFYVIEEFDGSDMKEAYKAAIQAYIKLRIIEDLYFIEKRVGSEPCFMDKNGFLKRAHSMGLSIDAMLKNEQVVRQGLSLRSAANRGKAKALKYVLEPIIPEKSIVLLYSTFGIGKTWAAITFAYSIALGVKSCDRLSVPEPRKVLFIDSEMSNDAMVERLEYMEKIYPDTEGLSNNFLWHSVNSDEHTSSLNLEEDDDRKLVDKMLANAEDEGTKGMPVSLLILDNISTLTGGSNTHSSWMKIFHWLYKIKSAGCSVLVLHHENKAGGYLGTVLKGITVDCKVHLEKIEVPTREVEFNVVIEKARRLHGESKKPFTMGIDLNVDKPRWETYSEQKETQKEAFKEMDHLRKVNYCKKLKKRLKTNKNVAAFLGIGLSTLYKYLKKEKLV